MNLPIRQDIETTADHAQLHDTFKLQRSAYFDQPTPDYQQRKSDLQSLRTLLIENKEQLVQAICDDYGNRSTHESQLAEVVPVLDEINATIKSLKKWMKVEKRHCSQSMYFGGKNRVIHQPLGVIGLIVPWNFPLNLSFSQIIAAFSAGNRVMVKMSENSINLTRLLQKISPSYLPEDKLAFFEETGSVGIEFSKIRFDLIIFTGSGQTGKAVMAAAAKNLTPVILELGGKAPAIIDPSYPLAKAVERILYVKQFNAGQICTNVDYVFVPENQQDEFIELAKQYVSKHCPDILHDDYTSIIDDRAYSRVNDTLEDARAKGATVVNLNPQQEANAETRKIPLHLILDSTEDMTIRQRETFGPLLLVMTYSDPQEAIDYINSGDRPLALYPFTNDSEVADRYIDRIMSGGVTVNDALLHVAQHDLPFGGVGESGMGHYHGYEGFLACSKSRPVFYQAKRSTIKYLAPPYGKMANKIIGTLIKMKSK